MTEEKILTKEEMEKMDTSDLLDYAGKFEIGNCTESEVDNFFIRFWQTIKNREPFLNFDAHFDEVGYAISKLEKQNEELVGAIIELEKKLKEHTHREDGKAIRTSEL